MSLTQAPEKVHQDVAQPESDLEKETFSPRKNLFLSTLSSTLTRAKKSVTKAVGDFHHEYENKLEQGLTAHREAVSSVREEVIERASLARAGVTSFVKQAEQVAQKVHSKFDYVASEIASESKVGVATVRESAAYKVALEEARTELSIGLKLSRTLSAEQKRELTALASQDLETIKASVAEKFEQLLTQNTSLDFTRTQVRQHMPEIMAEGVNAVSKLTKDIQATNHAVHQADRQGSPLNVGDAYQLQRSTDTLSTADRSNLVSGIAGQQEGAKAFADSKQPTAATATAPADNKKAVEEVVATKLSAPEPAPAISLVATPSASVDLNNFTVAELRDIAAQVASSDESLRIRGASRMRKDELAAALQEAQRSLVVEQVTTAQQPLLQSLQAAATKQDGASTTIIEQEKK